MNWGMGWSKCRQLSFFPRSHPRRAEKWVKLCKLMVKRRRDWGGENKMATKWYQLSKWEGMSKIKDPIAVPYFFLRSGPTLVLTLYPEWLKRKNRDCPPFSISNEKGGAPFNISYFLYWLQMNSLKSLKKTDSFASLIWRINKRISDSWGTSRHHLPHRLPCRPNRGLSTQKRECMRDKLIQCMIL